MYIAEEKTLKAKLVLMTNGTMRRNMCYVTYPDGRRRMLILQARNDNIIVCQYRRDTYTWHSLIGRIGDDKESLFEAVVDGMT